MLSDLITALIHACPFPRVSPSGVRPGVAWPVAPECSGCRDRRCLSGDKDGTWSTCYRGMDTFRSRIGDTAMVFGGFLTPTTYYGLSRKRKREMERWRVDPDLVTNWVVRLENTLTAMAEQVEVEVKESLSAFHDVQSTVSALVRGAEDVVRGQPGDSFDAQLDSLPADVRGLVQSTFLLQARLQLMPLVTNPEAARYGDRHRTPVYRVFDRVIRMLRPLGSKKSVSVRLLGSSFNQPDGFNSFEVIPLVLVENAIKYSLPRQTVDVTVEDVPGQLAVSVEITSFSPKLDPDESASIFTKGFRGRHSSTVASSGSGIGLHLAQVVADAHGFGIRHRCGDEKTRKDGIPYCENTFSFTFG